MPQVVRGAYVRVISGRSRGVLAEFARFLLAAASLPYLLAVSLRNAYYGLGRWTVVRPGRPAISVGNLTVGGTGKTPLVAWIARHFEEKGLRPAILTRGYKGKPIRYSDDEAADAARQWRVESDEAALLTRLCPRSDVVIDPDRAAGAARAAERGADVLILDDGFQHRRLGRDLDIVLIDATCPFGYGHVLPRGLLREPVGSLRRAGLVIITRSDLIDPSDKMFLLSTVRRLVGERPVLESRHVVYGFSDLRGRAVEGIDAHDMQAVVFAGIGRFDSFRESVERMGVRVVAAYEYPDHHVYSADEVASLVEVAARLDANVLLTTEKDAVKLHDRWPADAALQALALRLRIEFSESDVKILTAAVDAALGSRSPKLRGS